MYCYTCNSILVTVAVCTTLSLPHSITPVHLFHNHPLCLFYTPTILYVHIYPHIHIVLLHTRPVSSLLLHTRVLPHIHTYILIGTIPHMGVGYAHNRKHHSCPHDTHSWSTIALMMFTMAAEQVTVRDDKLALQA